jgi:cytochrome bd-type quinol oxidase subunit 1
MLVFTLVPLAVVIPVALVLLGLIAWIALSKKSSPAIRRTAVGALILIGLSVILSLILIFSGPKTAVVSGPGTYSSEPAVPANPPSYSIVFFLAFLLSLLTLIIFFALRKEKKTGRTKASEGPPGTKTDI